MTKSKLALVGNVPEATWSTPSLATAPVHSWHQAATQLPNLTAYPTTGVPQGIRQTTSERFAGDGHAVLIHNGNV